jgi:hypothetical protein
MEASLLAFSGALNESLRYDTGLSCCLIYYLLEGLLMTTSLGIC